LRFSVIDALRIAAISGETEAEENWETGIRQFPHPVNHNSGINN
jgi:hypothetical protein